MSTEDFRIENGILTRYNGSDVEITIPEGITDIGVYAFAGNNSIKTVIIPDSINDIGSMMFEACTSLKSITIPVSVKQISGFAFYNCSNLSKVFYGGTSEEWSKISIYRDYNQPLYNATRYYYSETAPTESGNYWHYDENNNPVVW